MEWLKSLGAGTRLRAPDGDEMIVSRTAKRWDNGYMIVLNCPWYKANINMRVDDKYPDIVMLRKAGGHRRFMNYTPKDFARLD